VQERQRLARELHDSVSQALYGISLGAYTAREALESDPREAIAPLEYVVALSEAGLAEMRALLFELRPESLATEGLVAALSKQVTVLRTRYKLLVEAQLGEEPALSLEGKQALYRTAQEALHNIIKHAHARTVILRLSRQEGDLLLEIGDDGKGFEPTGPFPGHFGLLSMQERAAELGGTCSIESAPAQGTRLRVCVPLHDELGSAGEKESSPDPTSVSRSEHSLFSVSSSSRRGC
jgi:signal transduction histidine kinase